MKDKIIKTGKKKSYFITRNLLICLGVLLGVCALFAIPAGIAAAYAQAKAISAIKVITGLFHF